MNVLIVGGAGYIGSHFAKSMARAGHEAVVLDNLCSGHRNALRYGPFFKGDAGDASLLGAIFNTYPIDAVAHFASHIRVDESLREPSRYYANNVIDTLRLLDSMRSFGVRRFLFSSSAAVYGIPREIPVSERHSLNPVNPYGRSKLMVEQVLADYAAAYGLRHVSLRYFNAAGADPDGEIGEEHDPETHLIPLVLQTASGHRKHVTVYGNDYATRDGTCERDYVHVADLAEAHRLALDYLASGGEPTAFNLGSGQGHTVAEVIAAAKLTTGVDIPVEFAPRRAGDPDRLVADSGKANAILGWRAKRSDLDSIVGDAWRWELSMRSRGNRSADTARETAT